MKLTLRAVWLALAVVLLLPHHANAQTTPPPTPTPPLQTAERTAPLDLDFSEPFIQADLSVLSGNVQRPNGIFWHEGLLYTICNGDWTIYEIDAATGTTRTYLWGVRNAHTLYAETDADARLNLWVPDFQQNALVRVYQGQTQMIAEGLNGPWGITPRDANSFLVSNLLGGNVVQINREGNTRELVSGLRSPTGVVLQDDVLYVANNGSARRAIEWYDIRELGADPFDASAAPEAASLVTGVQNVTGMILGPDGYLYFAYALGTRGVVGRIDPVACRTAGGCTADAVEVVVYTDLAAPLAGLSLSPDMRLFVHTIFSPDLYYVDLAARAVVADDATDSGAGA